MSPKLRKIREGLDQLNLPADVLLRHGRKRIVYGIPLIRNLRKYLLGMDDTPDFLFSFPGAKATRLVSNWWIERWLSKRIDRDTALDDVAANTLVSPIRHGARVVPPKPSDHESSCSSRTSNGEDRSEFTRGQRRTLNNSHNFTGTEAREVRSGLTRCDRIAHCIASRDDTVVGVGRCSPGALKERMVRYGVIQRVFSKIPNNEVTIRKRGSHAVSASTFEPAFSEVAQ